jgi:hypothetical protein
MVGENSRDTETAHKNNGKPFRWKGYLLATERAPDIFIVKVEWIKE